VFKSVDETLKYFQKQGYIGDMQLRLPETAAAPRERGRSG